MQSTMKKPTPRKPRLPTPPDSPTNIILSEQELACPSKIHLVPRQLKYNPATRLPRPPTTSTSYLSDDSGVGTCNTSDMSDDCDICMVSDTFKDFGGTCTDSYRAHCKTRNIKTQKCCMQKSIYFDQIKEKEKLRHKVETLHSMRCLISQKLIAADDCLIDIISKLGHLTSKQEEERVYRYVQDVERITLLMSSLARRLARTELRVRMHGIRNYQELKNQIRKIQEQLDDANIIDRKLKEKKERIAHQIENCLGANNKEKFMQYLNDKSNLLIAAKELDEKISMSNEHFRMIQK